MYFKIVVIIAFLLNNFYSIAQISLDSIVDMHLKTTGFTNLQSVFKNFVIEGEIMQKNISFPIKIKGILPDKFRMDMIFNQVTFISVSDGNAKWEFNPVTDSLIKGESNSLEAQNFIDRWCGALIKYKTEHYSGKLMGLTTIDDIEVYKIELKVNEKSQVYFIDKYSYLIVRIDDDFVENKITYYSDYRKIGNYFLPCNITGYENGIPIMSMKFSDVKIDAELSATEFKKPKQKD